ncbi:MAG: hypothetical protein HYZ50_04335 [Deltaproteobacteria bacterium]|nr:hypothetical protein [Deltaproteobacteria bacterium]
MLRPLSRRGFTSACFATTLLLSVVTFAQDHHAQHLGPLLRPMVKMTGFVNAKIEPPETRPVVTLLLPGHEERYTFLITDIKLLAGPLRTPSDILAEVKPYSPNFRLRGPQEVVNQVSSATPVDQLVITAEYASSDRLLLVQSIEKVEESKK